MSGVSTRNFNSCYRFILDHMSSICTLLYSIPINLLFLSLDVKHLFISTHSGMVIYPPMLLHTNTYIWLQGAEDTMETFVSGEPLLKFFNWCLTCCCSLKRLYPICFDIWLYGTPYVNTELKVIFPNISSKLS